MCRVKIGDSKADSSPHPTLFSQGIGRAPRNKPVPPFFVLQEQTYILRESLGGSKKGKLTQSPALQIAVDTLPVHLHHGAPPPQGSAEALAGGPGG